jgi:hypothetical protein
MTRQLLASLLLAIPLATPAAVDDLTLTEFQAGRVVDRILEAREILTRLQRTLACSPLA